MSAPKMAIVVFSRMSSQRLPGKALRDFNGRPLLVHILERARPLGLPLIVATSDQPEDAAIVELAQRHGAQGFHGSLDNVLQRAIDCAHAHRLDAFARLCGDRPYFPVEPMRQGLEAMRNSWRTGAPLDLASNHIPQSPPAGLSTEVVRVAALERAAASAPDARHREHLTAWLYDHADGLRIQPLPGDFQATGGHRFAVDTAEDHRRLVAAATVLGDVHASAEAVAAWLAAAPADAAGRT